MLCLDFHCCESVVIMPLMEDKLIYLFASILFLPYLEEAVLPPAPKPVPVIPPVVKPLPPITEPYAPVVKGLEVLMFVAHSKCHLHVNLTGKGLPKEIGGHVQEPFHLFCIYLSLI